MLTGGGSNQLRWYCGWHNCSWLGVFSCSANVWDLFGTAACTRMSPSPLLTAVCGMRAWRWLREGSCAAANCAMSCAGDAKDCVVGNLVTVEHHVGQRCCRVLPLGCYPCGCRFVQVDKAVQWVHGACSVSRVGAPCATRAAARVTGTGECVSNM